MSTGRIKQVKIKLGRGRKPPPPYAESYKALPERLLGLFAGELNPTTNTFLLPLLFSLDRNNTAHSNGCVCCQSEIVFVNVVDLNINGIACCICHRNVNKLISKSVVYSGRCVGYQCPKWKVCFLMPHHQRLKNPCLAFWGVRPQGYYMPADC